MEKQSINIVETDPIKKIKSCIIGFPDVGLVGLISVNHIKNSLNLEESGYFESDILPPIVVIHKGEPKAPIRIFNKGELAVLTSEIPLPESIIPIISRKIVEWTKSKDVELLISISGIAVPNRIQLEKPEVFGVASSNQVQSIIKEAKIPPLEEGFMVGAHALILRESIKNTLANLSLMAQSHYQYPDPGAAAASIIGINNILGLNIDIKSLLDQAQEIRLKLRELMQRTTKQMEKMGKAQEQELPPMYV